jgi:hypothetical protein
MSNIKKYNHYKEMLMATETLRAEINMYCYNKKGCVYCPFELHAMLCLKEKLSDIELILKQEAMEAKNDKHTKTKG